MILPHKTS